MLKDAVIWLGEEKDIPEGWKKVKVTKLYHFLSLLRDKNTPFTGLIDWVRDLLWNRYYDENKDMYL